MVSERLYELLEVQTLGVRVQPVRIGGLVSQALWVKLTLAVSS